MRDNTNDFCAVPTQLTIASVLALFLLSKRNKFEDKSFGYHTAELKEIVCVLSSSQSMFVGNHIPIIGVGSYKFQLMKQNAELLYANIG